MTDTPLKDRLHTMALALDRAGQCNAAVYMQEAADRIEALEREVETLRGLISEKSIEAIAEDIAIACVDCRQEIRDARNRAMLRLGERLRKPLPIDLKRASLSNIEEDAS